VHYTSGRSYQSSGRGRRWALLFYVWIWNLTTAVVTWPMKKLHGIKRFGKEYLVLEQSTLNMKYDTYIQIRPLGGYPRVAFPHGNLCRQSLVVRLLTAAEKVGQCICALKVHARCDAPSLTA
jgi:hypothetical protein